MEETINNVKDCHSVKLIRGQRGSYGWEIKIVGDNINKIIENLVKTNIELNSLYSVSGNETED